MGGGEGAIPVYEGDWLPNYQIQGFGDTISPDPDRCVSPLFPISDGDVIEFAGFTKLGWQCQWVVFNANGSVVIRTALNNGTTTIGNINAYQVRFSMFMSDSTNTTILNKTTGKYYHYKEKIGQ